jgi:hypothetical protein
MMPDPSPLMGEGLGEGGVSGKAPFFIDVHPTPTLPIEGREL